MTLFNEKKKNKWIIVLDIPFYSGYIGQFLFSFLINDYIFNQFISYDYDSECQSNIITIDRSFFYDINTLIEFIRLSTIPLNSKIVIYSFPYSYKSDPIIINNYEIIMLFDFTTY